MNKRYLGMFFLAAAVFLAGCSKGQVMDGPDMVGTPEYIQIDQETAKEMMGRDDGHQEIPVLVITAEDKTFYADLEDNSSAEALIERLSSGGVVIDLHDYGSFEKVGPLPWDLPSNDETITTQPGDVILYQGSQITIYYDENTWDFTRLAKIPDITKDELLEAFGDGNVSVTFSIEWRE